MVCEDAAQAAKIAQVRGRLPHLRHVILIDAAPVEDSVSLRELRERGRARPTGEVQERIAAVTEGDPYTFIYTSGTTGPPKGCVLAHSNYRDVLDMCHRAQVNRDRETTYLYLPLAHAFALLMELLSFDRGSTLCYWSGDPQRIIPELQETRPTYFPSVPRVFEKIYAMATATLEQASDEERERFAGAVKLGVHVRDLLIRGEPVPEDLQAPFAQAEEQLYARVRGLFGGNLRQR